MTKHHPSRDYPRTGMPNRILTAVIACIAAMLAAPAAAGALEITNFDGAVNADQAGNPYTQAGGHPYDASTTFTLETQPDPNLFGQHTAPDMRDIVVDVPPGLVGNPLAVPHCTRELARLDRCPPDTQVGLINLVSTSTDPPPALGPEGGPLYNLVPTQGAAAQFGFKVLGVLTVITAEVPADPAQGLRLRLSRVNQGLNVAVSKVMLWGKPFDPAHDADRGANNAPQDCGVVDDPLECSNAFGGSSRVPFLTLPTACTADGVGLETGISITPWIRPEESDSASFVSHLPPGYPLPPDQWGAAQGPTGCDQLAFDPSVSVQPTSRAADGPTGLDVELSLPQDGLVDPSRLATAHLKRAAVTLPEGMSINPAAADGLMACDDARLGLKADSRPSCPDGSRVGEVDVRTPLLDETLPGSVYIRPQASDDPASGDLFRLALVIESEERGVFVKLPGRVAADPSTGRLTATFDDNPQLPFSSLRVRFKGGARAPLALPETCGTKTVRAELSSWAQPGVPVVRTDSFEIACPIDRPFDPSFAAGSVSPTGGAFSPFVARIGRPEGHRFLSDVEVGLPKGLVAKLRGVELCPDHVAGDGTPGVCPAGSRIGSAIVGAGSGNPYYLHGDVYLTGPYQGAPYGLSVQVAAKAGPFDLGMVKVRQALHVDPETAEITVASDRLPQIVKGVPVRLRDVEVDVDRPDFTINPTSCSEKRIDAVLTSIDGTVRTASQRFGASDCRALGFKPRMAMRLTGKRQTRTGGHPGFRTVLTQKHGEAGIGHVKVTMPSSIVLDPNNTVDPKMLCGYDESLTADCPQTSVIGKATAQTPVLDRPLTGAVHLVQGIKFGPSGNRIRTTPSLLVKLRGDVAINLRARTTTQRGTNRLVTIFPAVPDAPVSKFNLSINGGSKGILTVTRTRRAKLDLCSSRQVASVETDAHNGKRADYTTKIMTPCAKPTKKTKRRR